MINEFCTYSYAMEEVFIYPSVSADNGSVVREQRLLSLHMYENGYKLEHIHIVWHPVPYVNGSYADSARERRGFFADVKVINRVTQKKMSFIICPKYATVDLNVFYGYDCDDLLIEIVREHGISVTVMWSHAVYGQTFAPCTGDSYSFPRTIDDVTLMLYFRGINESLPSTASGRFEKP